MNRNNKTNTGIRGGYIRKDFVKSPFNNKKIARCDPQSGQSIPNNDR